MDPRSSPAKLERRARRRLCIVAGALFALPLEPGLQTAAGDPRWSRHSDRDAIVDALEMALDAYGRGEVATARAQAELAVSLLGDQAVESRGRRHWPNGNARQVLDVLDLYDMFASGTDAARDASVDSTRRWLCTIDTFNHATWRPSTFHGRRVDYDLLRHVVRRIGDMPIDYDLITQQITRIGDVRIDYDLITRAPTRIGDVGVDYDLIDKHVRRIAGVDARH